MLSLGYFFRTETCIRVHLSVLTFCSVVMLGVWVHVVVDVLENVVYVRIDSVVIRIVGIVDVVVVDIVVVVVDQLVKRMVFAVL